MDDLSREQLLAYLDDSLSETEMAQIEKALRASADLRERLKKIRESKDRGEHSLGAIWRRERLSCVSREQLNGYLHGTLEPDFQKYVEFHLQTIQCPMCIANWDDLKEKQTEAPATQTRRKKIFDSSAGILSRVSGKE